MNLPFWLIMFQSQFGAAMSNTYTTLYQNNCHLSFVAPQLGLGILALIVANGDFNFSILPCPV